MIEGIPEDRLREAYCKELRLRNSDDGGEYFSRANELLMFTKKMGNAVEAGIMEIRSTGTQDGQVGLMVVPGREADYMDYVEQMAMASVIAMNGMISNPSTAEGLRADAETVRAAAQWLIDETAFIKEAAEAFLERDLREEREASGQASFTPGGEPKKHPVLRFLFAVLVPFVLFIANITHADNKFATAALLVLFNIAAYFVSLFIGMLAGAGKISSGQADFYNNFDDRMRVMDGIMRVARFVRCIAQYAVMGYMLCRATGMI